MSSTRSGSRSERFAEQRSLRAGATGELCVEGGALRLCGYLSRLEHAHDVGDGVFETIAVLMRDADALGDELADLEARVALSEGCMKAF